MKKLTIQAEAFTAPGLQRHDNQDALLVRVGEGPWGDFGLFAVADGMGGAAGGNLASEMAVRACEDWWREDLASTGLMQEKADLAAVGKCLSDRVVGLNGAVAELGRRLGDRTGTTLSVLFLTAFGYCILHVGDSRIYWSDRGTRCLTEDDTYVAEQVRRGMLTARQAQEHPKRHLLTRCVGMPSGLQVRPVFGAVEPGAFLLCTDGFYQSLTDEEIRQAAYGGREGLCAAARQVYGRGAPDNLTAVTVSVREGDGRT